MPVSTGHRKFQTNIMKAYQRPRQYFHHPCQLGHVSPGLSLLVSVCVLMLPMLGLVDEHVQLTTMYHMSPTHQCYVHPCHMTSNHIPLLLPSVNNVLPAMALQNRVVNLNIRSPFYTSSSTAHDSTRLALTILPGLLKILALVLVLLLLLSGDIETNPGPLGQGDLKILHRELHPVSNKWFSLGVQLQVPVETLKCIEMENRQITKCLLEMLIVWLEQINPPCSWSILTEALESPPLGERLLAQQLRDKYYQRTGEEVTHGYVQEPSLCALAAQQDHQLKPYERKAKPTGIELGSGTYGTVIELRSAGEIVAGKVFKTSLTTDHHKLCGELSLMAQVHHPNIVQCKGVCRLEDQTMPVLLMERLMSSLHAYLLDPIRSNLALERKVSILHDVASGLKYLHSNKPTIIHRDLTAKNVLLDSELTAKIADFGNARIMDLDPETTPETFTSLPGTRDYMPPEAEGGTKYDSSLDVFSFGHLSLFTIIQSPVHPLLPSTYTDDEGLHARSEVKRREQYLEKAEELLGEEHSLVVLVKQCLHNYPAQRPQTADLVTRLQDTSHTLEGADCTLHSQPDTMSHNQPAGPTAEVQAAAEVLSEANDHNQPEGHQLSVDDLHDCSVLCQNHASCKSAGKKCDHGFDILCRKLASYKKFP